MATAKISPIPPFLFLLFLISSPILTLSSHTSPSPSPSLSLSSPPSPSPSYAASPLSPTTAFTDFPTLSPAPATSDPMTSPVPSPAHEVNKAADVSADLGGGENKEDKGMSGGKKAGIALGVIAAVGVVGLGVVVYRKRQENIRRSRYGYNARMMEMV